MTQQKQLKLMDLERDKGIKIFDESISDGSKYITFNHLDGMYSYCTTEKGGVIHLSVGTPLVECEGGYKIKEMEND